MTVPRSLNDRVAEAMRRERIGDARPLWRDFSDDNKEDWLNRAERLRSLLEGLGVFMTAKD